MGISSKKTTTTQNSTSTTTPNNPSWITDPIQNLVGQIGNLGATNPQNYVAPASSLQQQAFGQGAQTLGSTSGLYGDGISAIKNAMGSGAPSVKAASLLENLDAYVNPELENVVRNALENYDVTAGQTQAQYAAQGARNKAFGGSRYGLGESALLSDLTRGRATTESGLRSDAWDKAFGYSNLDADRRQGAAIANAGFENSAIDRMLSGGSALAGIGQAQDSSNRANIGLLADLGGIERDIAQSQATAPLSLLQAQQALLSGLPLSMFGGQTMTGQATGTSKSSDPLGGLGGLLSGLGAISGGIGAAGGIGSFFK